MIGVCGHVLCVDLGSCWYVCVWLGFNNKVLSQQMAVLGAGEKEHLQCREISLIALLVAES